MGIRMLHRRTPEAETRAAWEDTASARDRVPASPVPALAADASTARVPVDLAESVRTAVRRLRRALAALTAHADRIPHWRQWTDLARGYLALALALVPRPRPRRTVTVFVASLTGRPTGPGARRPPHREHPERRQHRDPGEPAAPGPDATA